MSVVRRIFFDVTFTRTQVGSVGITRTVRRLGEEIIKSLPDGVSFTPVAFHSSGFRAVDPPREGTSAPAASDRAAARAVRAIGSGLLRRVAVRWLPVPLLLVAERMYNGVLFDRMTRDAPTVVFQPGDVVFMCDAGWARPVWKAAGAARAQGASVVTMVHDLIPLQQQEFATQLVTQVFQRWLAGVLANSDAIVCNSQSTQESLASHAAEHGLELPPVGHFRLGCDLATAMPAVEARKKIADFLNGSMPCFGIVGTIEPRKNHAWLLRGFEQLWAQGRDVRLIVVGRKNPECHDLIERMLCHPEQGRRMLTVLDANDAEVALVYARARSLLFPSLAEGFGLPLVEARTRGCPVIASDLPVFEELADDGVFLYPRASSQALQSLVLAHAAEDQRPRVGWMDPFTWSDSARQLLEVSATLLGSRHAAARRAPAQAGHPA